MNTAQRIESDLLACVELREDFAIERVDNETSADLDTHWARWSDDDGEHSCAVVVAKDASDEEIARQQSVLAERCKRSMNEADAAAEVVP